jgi:hypothetical protein
MTRRAKWRTRFVRRAINKSANARSAPQQGAEKRAAGARWDRERSDGFRSLIPGATAKAASERRASIVRPRRRPTAEPWVSRGGEGLSWQRLEHAMNARGHRDRGTNRRIVGSIPWRRDPGVRRLLTLARQPVVECARCGPKTTWQGPCIEAPCGREVARTRFATDPHPSKPPENVPWSSPVWLALIGFIRSGCRSPRGWPWAHSSSPPPCAPTLPHAPRTATVRRGSPAKSPASPRAPGRPPALRARCVRPRPRPAPRKRPRRANPAPARPTATVRPEWCATPTRTKRARAPAERPFVPKGTSVRLPLPPPPPRARPRPARVAACRSTSCRAPSTPTAAITSRASRTPCPSARAAEAPAAPAGSRPSEVAPAPDRAAAANRPR